MSVKIAEQGQLICAPVSMIWENLYQVKRWSQWVSHVQRVEMLETPKAEAIGRILPDMGTPYHFRFQRVTRDHLVRWERPFRMGTQLVESCSLVRNVEGAIVMLELWCEGGLERQVKFWFRRRLSQELVRQSLKLKELCENQYVEMKLSAPAHRAG